MKLFQASDKKISSESLISLIFHWPRAEKFLLHSLAQTLTKNDVLYLTGMDNPEQCPAGKGRSLVARLGAVWGH